MKNYLIESTIIDGFNNLMNASINDREIILNGIPFNTADSFEGFRILLKEFYIQNKKLDFFYPILDNFIELLKADKLNITQEETLMDTIKIINGDCPLNMTLEYPDKPSSEYRYIPKW